MRWWQLLSQHAGWFSEVKRAWIKTYLDGISIHSPGWVLTQYQMDKSAHSWPGLCSDLIGLKNVSYIQMLWPPIANNMTIYRSNATQISWLQKSIDHIESYRSIRYSFPITKSVGLFLRFQIGSVIPWSFARRWPQHQGSTSWVVVLRDADLMAPIWRMYWDRIVCTDIEFPFICWLVVTGTMEFLMTFQKQLGMSSSQLTKSIIFQRGRAQPPTRY